MWKAQSRIEIIGIVENEIVKIVKMVEELWFVL